jgi:multidrug efflux pump subunit AcrA (membrane-fusion protein)
MPLRSYRARFAIVDPDKSTLKLVRLGMSAEVTIPTGDTQSQANSFTLPAASIISQGDTAFVWVISNEKSILLKKPVTLTKMVNQGVVVSGLQQGEKVVVAGTEKLNEGQLVRAIERSGTAFEPDAQQGAVR